MRLPAGAFALPLAVSVAVASASFIQAQSPRDAPLLLAARQGDVAKAAALLAAGADANVKSEYGITPIMYAADNANFALVKLLIEHGANPDARDLEYGKTALYLVSYSGRDQIKRKEREQIISLLLDKGSNGGVALENLIKEDYVDAAKRIVARGGVDPVYLNRALQAAKRAGQPALVELLQQAGAKDPGPADSPRSPERFGLIAGLYRNESGQELTLRLDHDDLMLERAGQRRVALLPALYTVDLFRTFDEKVVLTLTPGPVPPKEVTLVVAGRADVYLRTANISPTTPERGSAETSTMPLRRPIAAGASSSTATLASHEWPSFRGFLGSGVAADTHPPAVWDAEKKVNIRWETPIPGLGHSSPIVWRDRVFVTTSVPKTAGDITFLHAADANNAGSARQAKDDIQSWRVYAIDKRTGRILWERVTAEGVPKTQRHVMQSQANPTPATDGTHLVVWFGSEGLYCYDLDGTLLWKRDLGVISSGMYQYPDYEWNTATSPIIYRNLVIIQADVLDPTGSFIAAFDVATGKEVWRTKRDERASWTTPFVFEGASRRELITAAGDFARGYDPDTGKELWRFGKHSIFSTPTPIAGDGLIYITSGGGVTIQPIYALRPGARGNITLDDGEDSNEYIVWSTRRGGPYIPTPIFYNGLLYVCSNNGILAAYQGESGKKLYQQRLSQGGNYTASAVAADGKLYYANEEGTVVVVRAGARFEEIAANPIGDVIMATPAISDDMIIVRTQHKLIAVGEPSSR